jgi:hypothetical protein
VIKPDALMVESPLNGRLVEAITLEGLLPAYQAGLLAALRKVEECGPRLPTHAQNLQKCSPWSEQRLDAFSDLLASYKRFRKLYGDGPCPPKVIRFLRLWMRLNEINTKWVLKNPRGRPWSRRDADNNDPDREAAEIAHELRDGRVGRVYVPTADGQKITPVEAAVARVNERLSRLGDPRRCNAMRVRRILRRGLGTYET